MISMKCIQNKSCPIVIYDKCQEQITEADDAMVVFDTDYKDGQESKTEFFHKRSCDPGKKVTTWVELSNFLADLTHNTGLRGKKFTDAVAQSKRTTEAGL